MLSVVVQNDFVKYDIDNYYVEGNKIRSYVDRMMGGERIAILNLAEYKTHEEAVGRTRTVNGTGIGLAVDMAVVFG